MSTHEAVSNAVKTLIATLPDDVAYNLVDELSEHYESKNPTTVANDLSTRITRLRKYRPGVKRQFVVADGVRIRQKYASGMTSHQISVEENCSGKTILRIVGGVYKYRDATPQKVS